MRTHLTVSVLREWGRNTRSQITERVLEEKPVLVCKTICVMSRFRHCVHVHVNVTDVNYAEIRRLTMRRDAGACVCTVS